MKFHRVLLFTSIQMDITEVGKDLHVLLTNSESEGIAATVYSAPLPDSDPPECEVSSLVHLSEVSNTFCDYVAENLSKQTGRNVLCTGGLFVPDPDERQTMKLYENIDEMIHDWIHFLD